MVNLAPAKPLAAEARGGSAWRIDPVIRPAAAAGSLRFAWFGMPWVLAALGAGAWMAGPASPTGGAILLFLGVSATLGMFHGATDAILARLRVPEVDRLRRLPGGHGISYLLLMAVTVAVWWISPFTGLVIFLAATVYHWGTGDTARWSRGWPRTVAGVGRGLLVLGAAFRSDPAEAARILTLAGGLEMTGSAVVYAGNLLLTVSAMLTLLALGAARDVAAGDRVALGVESVALAGLFLALPVYLALTIYYGAFHSLRHLIRVRDLVAAHVGGTPAGRRRAEWGRLAALPLIVTALLVPLAGAPSLGLAAAPAWEHVVLAIQTLAVLTTPHLVTVALLDAGGVATDRPAAGYPR